MTRNKVTLASIAGALAIMAGSVATLPATAAEGASASAIEKGKSVAFSRKKGNCLACHMMGDGAAAGNIGPPLIAMKSRYPEKAKLPAAQTPPAERSITSLIHERDACTAGTRRLLYQAARAT